MLNVCKTNIPSNTAFRGFGGPQGMMIGETILDKVANVLNKDPQEIRWLNLYQEGDKTHYNQLLDNCTLNQCWNECFQRSNYEAQRIEIEEYNSRNRWKKRISNTEMKMQWKQNIRKKIEEEKKESPPPLLTL